jgi:hypothetical protein
MIADSCEGRSGMPLTANILCGAAGEKPETAGNPEWELTKN